MRGFTGRCAREMLGSQASVKVTCVHPGGIKRRRAQRHRGRRRTSRRSRSSSTAGWRCIRRNGRQTIVNGVAKGQARVVVSLEAKAIDLLAHHGLVVSALVAAGVKFGAKVGP